ncbi:MAG: adenosylcobinamide-GDP ribazoletransferase [Pseudomonadota bacterium]
MKDEAARFLLALQFLTRVPTPSEGLYSPQRMATSVRYYPFVGILIGMISALVLVAASHVLPATIAVMIAVASGLLITGGFHEDGLADTFDGIGGGANREHALSIMKDSRLGTFGTLALMVVVGLKVAALSTMTTPLAAASLVAAHGLSRLSSILVIPTSDYVRDTGTAKPVAKGSSAISLAVALATGAAIVITWAVFGPKDAVLLGLLGVVVGHVGMRAFFERKLGGYTGDTLGAVQQASEICFYVAVTAWL